MKRFLIVLAVLIASPVFGQDQPLAPFRTVASVNLSELTHLSMITVLAKVEANGRPGDELLFYDANEQRWVLGVMHASKSGPGGSVAAPGLCTEAMFKTQTDPGLYGFMSLSVLDWNGDGISDLILWSPGSGAIPAEIIEGRGAQLCR